jgi:hypothetical protein
VQENVDRPARSARPPRPFAAGGWRPGRIAIGVYVVLLAAAAVGVAGYAASRASSTAAIAPRPSGDASPTVSPPAARTASPTPSPTGASASSVAATGAASTGQGLDLVSGTASASPFPLQLGPDIATRMGAPEVSLTKGVLEADYSAKDPLGDADISLLVGPGRPAFGPAAGPVSEAACTVRGHSGVLHTVAVQPAAQLTLYWPESPDRWVQLRSDDTYPPDQLIQFADALRPAAEPVPLPFAVNLIPRGATIVTATDSTIDLQGSGSGADAAARSVHLAIAGSGPPAGRGVLVGSRSAVLTSGTADTALYVDRSDLGGWLDVTTPGRGPAVEADLERLAGSVQATP